MNRTCDTNRRRVLVNHFVSIGPRDFTPQMSMYGLTMAPPFLDFRTLTIVHGIPILEQVKWVN